ncbi:hypothetical protein BD410DRAFT_811047 [Rickenella mellea]|uniref:Peptidase S54 rhomboid domain-containing protein n=1 Tax=Rickenella mellea TaxID=50990 RepID=A0A4R5XE76_9AGAM|nr:hypothetical protein BD410DRAFT_811047 [Rickenella mellea]
MSFHHAAVSKGLMLCCAASSIAASIFDVKHYLHLQLVPHLSRHHQYWRLLLHHLPSSNSSDLLLTELLLYNASIPVERLFGGVKFASFAVVTVLTSILLEFSALLLFGRLGLNFLPSGPTSLVFSILYQYYRLVPPAYSFKILGVTLTNKVFIYIVALQLSISQPPGSAALSIVGLLAGQLYRSDVLGLKTYRLPRSVQAFSVRFLLPLIGSTKPPRRSNRATPEDVSVSRIHSIGRENEEVITTASSNANSRGSREEPPTSGLPGPSVMREWVNELTGRAERAASGIRVPNEAEVSTVTSMFPDLRREDIVGALQRR